MQTPKSKPGSLEVPQKASATPQTAPQLMTPGSGSDPLSTYLYPTSGTPKDRSPKVLERRSPRSSVTEKRPSRVSELESLLTRLQDDLKKTKDQLGCSESWKRQAQQEIEEAKKDLLSMTAKLEESQQQLLRSASEGTGESIALAEAARAAEQEALMKIAYLTVEAEKNSRRAARVTEQLDAARSAKSEMEAELRSLKVQSDQWRKAAETAAAMLSTGNNGKIIERTVSLDNYHSIGVKMASPFSDNMGDDSSKKKNRNMLKKIGVLWRKSKK